MKILLFLLLSFSVFAEPIWLEEPYQYCDKENELCFGGKGITEEKAESVVKNQIKKYFKQYLRNFYIKLDKETLKNIDDDLFKYVKFKDYKKDTLYFKLAVLNIAKTKEFLEEKINEIDEEIKEIKDIEYLKNLYSIRFEYNKKYYTLTKKLIPEYTNYDEILKQSKTDIFIVNTSNEFEKITNDIIINPLKDKINITYSNNKNTKRLKTMIVVTNLISNTIKRYFVITINFANQKIEREFIISGKNEQEIKSEFIDKIKDIKIIL
jgi:hypothetical protein